MRQASVGNGGEDRADQAVQEARAALQADSRSIRPALVCCPNGRRFALHRIGATDPVHRVPVFPWYRLSGNRAEYYRRASRSWISMNSFWSVEGAAAVFARGTEDIAMETIGQLMSIRRYSIVLDTKE